MANSPKANTKAKKAPSVERAAIKQHYEQFYTDMFTLRERPIHDDYITKFALEWLTAILNDETIVTINRYPLLKGIQLGALDRWCKRVPDMDKTYKHIVDIIGERREHLALHNKINATVFLKGQHMYSPAWKASEEWRASLAAKVSGEIEAFAFIEIKRDGKKKEEDDKSETA